MLYRLGNGAAAHPWRTISAWLLVIGIAVVASSALGGTPQDDYNVPVVKRLGFGMATAIVLDATVVRLVLVPATMTMLGSGNWWLPAWLDRLLPTIEAETSADLWDELDDLERAPVVANR